MCEPNVETTTFEDLDLNHPPTCDLRRKGRDTVIGYRVYGPVHSVTLMIGGREIVNHFVKNGRFVAPLDIDLPLWRLDYHEAKLRACLRHDAQKCQTVVFEVLFGQIPAAHKRAMSRSSIDIAHPVGGYSAIDNVYIWHGMAFPEAKGELIGPTIGVKPIDLSTKHPPTP